MFCKVLIVQIVSLNHFPFAVLTTLSIHIHEIFHVTLLVIETISGLDSQVKFEGRFQTPISSLLKQRSVLPLQNKSII